MKKIVITEKDENGRLDKLLMKILSGAPKGFIFKMLRKKNIILNEKKATGNEILRQGDEISIFLSDDTFSKFSSIKEINKSVGSLKVLYEDDNIVIVNKDAGVLSQPAGNTDGDSVTERLAKYLRDKGEYDPSSISSFAPAVCNRLDRNTSGVIICGKNLTATREIAAMLKEHKVERCYITIVSGKLKGKGVIKAYHIKDGENNEALIHDEPVQGAKEIITEYEVVKSTREYSFVRIKLVTGKSHQIRAVMSQMGNPVIGDTKYGNPAVNGKLKRLYGLNYQLLHAGAIVFGDFSGRLSYLSGRRFECPLTEEFVKVGKALGLIV